MQPTKERTDNKRYQLHRCLQKLSPRKTKTKKKCNVKATDAKNTPGFFGERTDKALSYDAHMYWLPRFLLRPAIHPASLSDAWKNSGETVAVLVLVGNVTHMISRAELAQEHFLSMCFNEMRHYSSVYTISRNLRNAKQLGNYLTSLTKMSPIVQKSLQNAQQKILEPLFICSPCHEHMLIYT